MNQRELSLKQRAHQLARALTRRLLSSSQAGATGQAHVHHITRARGHQAPAHRRPPGGAGGQANP